jgi:hypothetical protein
VPSTIENSLCSRRWTKVGAGMGVEPEVLEFYRFHRRPPVLPSLSRFVRTPRLTCGAAACAVALAALAGCASAPPRPATAEPPPPAVNLSGFPLAYRQGYADGCDSAGGRERKDAARFAAEPNYRTGWQDGLALCRKR